MPLWKTNASTGSMARPTSSAFRAVDNRVHVYDLPARFLHLLGFDQKKFTNRYAGRAIFRLTDVYGEVVRALIG